MTCRGSFAFSAVSVGQFRWSFEAQAPRVQSLVKDEVMGPVHVELDQDLVAVLEELQRPVKEAARELIVLELYRQGELSSGKAAQLLGLEREDFGGQRKFLFRRRNRLGICG